MKRTSLLFALCLLPAAPAFAGQYADGFSKCLVSSTTSEDKQLLVKWIFAALGSHPALRELNGMTTAQRDAVDGQAAALFERVLTRDCRNEARLALEHEGSDSFGAAFGVLGQVAATEAFQHPDVNAAMQGMLKRVDEARLKSAFSAPQ